MARIKKDINCERCGKAFSAFQDHGKWPRFCSRACFCGDAVKPQPKKCLHCGKKFMAQRSRKNSSGLRDYCSIECRGFAARKFTETKCDTCGELFYPSRETQRFCSQQCYGRSIAGIPLTALTKSKLSKSLKEKFASGTRKPQPPETYAKSSKTLREGYATGRLKMRPLSSQKAKEMREKYPDELRAEQLRKVAQQKIGVPNPEGPSAKGADHWHARYWILKTPDGRTLKGWNLAEIVRQNEHLFDPSDVAWPLTTRSGACRAVRGLYSLFALKRDGSPQALSWKGWTIGERRDDDRDPEQIAREIVAKRYPYKNIGCDGD